jgi:HEAT repeat protein
MSTQTEAPEAEGSKTSLIVFSVIALIVAGLAFNSWRVRSGWLRDIRGNDPAARKAAAQAMMRRGQVAEQLQGQPPSIRLAAVRALAEVQTPGAAVEIIQFRKDPDEPIKNLAHQKLVQMGPAIVQEPALAALENSDDAIGTGVQDVLKDGQFTRVPDLKTNERATEQGAIPLVAKKLLHPDARNNAATILTDLDPPAIRYVIPYLHPNPDELVGTSTVEQVQLTAIGILDAQADPKAVSSIPSLVEMLKYQHTQRAAVGALGRMPAADAKIAVVPLLKVLGENELIRTETVVALGKLQDARAVPQLVQLLDSYSEELRGATSEALRAILSQNPGAIGPVLAAASSPDPTVRAGAIEAIGTLPVPAAASKTLAALKDPDAGVRIEAARALGERGEPQAVPALLAAFNDEDGRVGAAAAQALSVIGRPAVPQLVAALKAPAGSPQAYYAQQALRDIGTAALPALAQAARTGDDTTARFAALLIGDIGTPQGIAALKEVVRRPSPEVRWAAERSLQALEAGTAPGPTDAAAAS